MNAVDQLNGYLRRIERRLLIYAVSRGAAVVAALALLATVALVQVTNRYGFSDPSVWIARAILFLSLAAAAIIAVVVPLFGVSRRHAAISAESRFPEFQQRLLTVAENHEGSDPLLRFVAGDALMVAQESGPEKLVRGRTIFGFACSAGSSAALLAWLFAAGPGYLGYGTSRLWAGTPRVGAAKFYDIVVSPGDRMARRKTSQLITARPVGFQSDAVRLYAKSGGAAKWEQVEMRPQAEGPAFEFLFSALAEDVEYYVEAGAVRSKHYMLRVFDLPGVERIRVTYRFPSWMGARPATEDPGGDLRAVEGTEATIDVETDRPLDHGVLVLGSGSQIPLQKSHDHWITARVPIEKDDTYHVAAIESGGNVRLSEDYCIEAKKDLPPVVKLLRPSRDARVNPIEEIPVVVEASDDFGLKEVSVRFSVNGGPEITASLPAAGGGKYTIALEDYHLVPGDIVTLYAAARDARNTTYTDVYFIQAEPFERQYTQSQSSGAPTGGGNNQEQTEVSGREKEIIAATWNEIKQGPKDPAAARDDANSIGQLQEKLADQARSLSQRMRARQLFSAKPEFASFAKDMEAAAAEMARAAGKLKSIKWNEALPPAQKALQNALRAEDTFREIELGPRRASGQGTGRDLASLFDLELDTEKNQYETGQPPPSSAKRGQEIDAALKKLKELAKRQQELAQPQNMQPGKQSFGQRWEQETLRREAEELKRELERLQNQPRQQGNSQDRQSGQAADGRMQQVIDRLKQATEDMSRAEPMQNGSPEQGSAGQRRVAGRLQEATDMLSGMRDQQAAGRIDDVVRQAEQLSSHQNEYEKRLRQIFGNSSGDSSKAGERASLARAMAAEKEKMAAELKRLEQEIGDAAGSLGDSQTPTSSKLRDALAEAQQSELESRMRQGAAVIRQGEGLYMGPGEDKITRGLDRLQERLKDAQASLRPGDGKSGSEGDGKEQMERCLTQLERTREGLQQMGGSRANQKMLREVQKELGKLQQDVHGDKELSGDVQRLSAGLQAIATSQDPALFSDRLSREILPGMERLEAELRGRLGESRSQARNPRSDRVPAGYADSVAAYFRKLSGGR